MLSRTPESSAVVAMTMEPKKIEIYIREREFCCLKFEKFICEVTTDSISPF